MAIFFRISLLVLFAAVGAGGAIYLATHVAPPGETASPSPKRVASAKNASSKSGVPNSPSAHRLVDARDNDGYEPANRIPARARNIFLPVRNENGPLNAPHYPPVTADIDKLEATIQRAEKVTEQNRQLLQKAASLVQAPAAEPSPTPALPLLTPGAVPPVPIAPGALPLPGDGLSKKRVEKGAGDEGLTINIQDTDIREVLDLLSHHGSLNILASKNVQGKVSASLTKVNVMTALEAILKSSGFVARKEGNFIYVGTPQDFVDMDQTTDRISTRVYRPNYVKASEMQMLVTSMLTKGIGTVSISTAAEVGIPADGAKAGGDSFANAEVLLVRDYEAVLTQIDQVMQEVDRRPLQVSIEAMILSVKLADEFKLGVDFELLRDKNNIRIISGTPLADLADINVTDGGLKVGFLDSSTAAFLSALEKIGDTNVIAKPRLMVLNKQKAEILIGSQLGYVSTTVTENAATQAIEFLEVGTQLRLRPFISSDGLIRMEVHPELSTGNVRVESGFTLPDKEVTQVTTNIMCKDGCTVAIGGLFREDLTTNTTQIPFFGNLPLIGAAFRTKTEKTDKREVIVLITPRIIREEQACCEGDRASCEFHQHQAVYADKMSPIGKRYYGRRYFRLSQAAWRDGDVNVALRYINLSIHFDPQNREAVVLRSEITSAAPQIEGTVDRRLRVGLGPLAHPRAANVHRPWTAQELVGPPENEYMLGDPPVDESVELSPAKSREIVSPNRR